MPIYLGSTKQGTLYYGGTKIKEAYYGSTKVYNSFTPETLRFDYTGTVQTWAVPSGCTKLIVDCVGAAGATAVNGAGGKGGRVQCILNVASNQLLYIYIGGKGQYTAPTGTSAGGWNGGGEGYSSSYDMYGRVYNYCGGGGGSSDIRIGGSTLSDRKIVAGAGGGGFDTSLRGYTAAGGDGGGLIGETANAKDTTPAGGGTQSAGGSGAVYSSARASNGEFGVGGNGHKPISGSDFMSGPGGGGGWYGGGGGLAYSGGGGGSSYTDPNLCSNVVHTQGYSQATGNGWIIITTSNQ